MTTVSWLDSNRGECEGGGGANQSVYARKHGTSVALPDTAKLLLAPYKLHEIFVA